MDPTSFDDSDSMSISKVLNNLPEPQSAGHRAPDSQLQQVLNLVHSEEFCSATTREFTRLRAHTPDWRPEAEIPLFRDRMARAFDIAQDEQRVQQSVRSMGGNEPQAMVALSLMADREVPVAQHAVKDALAALDMLLAMGPDPETTGLLRDVRRLVVQARDQTAFDY